MKQFLDKITGDKISAVQFDIQKIDDIISELSKDASRFEIVYAWNENFIRIFFPFGKTKQLLIKPGDYVIRGEIIPGTIPQLHKFSVMDSYEFFKKFKPLGVIPNPSID